MGLFKGIAPHRQNPARKLRSWVAQGLYAVPTHATAPSGHSSVVIWLGRRHNPRPSSLEPSPTRRRYRIASTNTILTISSDALLQATRTLLLTRAGYSVVEINGCSSLLKSAEAATDSHIDLILMCHSVNESDRLRLCTLLRERYPTTPILLLYTIYESIPPEVNSSLQSLATPQELLREVEILLGPLSHQHNA